MQNDSEVEVARLWTLPVAEVARLWTASVVDAPGSSVDLLTIFQSLREIGYDFIPVAEVARLWIASVVDAPRSSVDLATISSVAVTASCWTLP